PQMLDVAQKLEGVSLFLQRIHFRICLADKPNIGYSEFILLFCARRLHKRADGFNCRSCRESRRDVSEARKIGIDDELQVFNGGAVRELYKRHLLRVSATPNPTL